MAKKYVEYQMNIVCEVTSRGAIVPVGSNGGIKKLDKNNNRKRVDLNILDYPPVEEIVLIWLGKMHQYPFMK